MPSHLTCPFCGASISPEARYCDHCGTPLSDTLLPPRRRLRAPGTLAIWAFVLITLLVFGSGTVGGFRYKAERWPWTPPPAQTVVVPDVPKPPPPQTNNESSTILGYLRSVVSISVRGEQGSSSGSGFIIDTKGHVVTSAHVVDGAASGCVTVFDDDGKPHQGTVLRTESTWDIALLRVPSLVAWPFHLELGESLRLETADPVYVLGSPKVAGSANFASAKVNRVVRGLRLSDQFFQELIQVTDATVVQGASGGPLVEMHTGQVVGVVAGGVGAAQIGYAVPIDHVADLLKQWSALPDSHACPAGPVNRITTPLILATITPLSGSFGVWGADLADGAALALRDLESDLKTAGYYVTLKRYDDRGSGTIAGEAAKNADFDQAVIGVVGSLDSQATAAIAAALKPGGMVMVAPVAGADELTTFNWAHLNRLVANSRRQEQALVRFAQEHLKVRSVAVIDDSSNDGIAVARVFETAAQVISLPVVERLRITQGFDVQEIGRKIVDSRAEAIYYAGRSDLALSLIPALRAEGIRLPVLGNDNLYDDRLATMPYAASHGIYFSNLTTAASDQFKRHFESALGKPTRDYAGYGYDAARVILDALVQYGHSFPGKIPSRPELAQLVRQTRGYQGYTGAVTFDAAGENQTARIFVFEWALGRAEQRARMD